MSSLSKAKYIFYLPISSGRSGGIRRDGIRLLFLIRKFHPSPYFSIMMDPP